MTGIKLLALWVQHFAIAILPVENEITPGITWRSPDFSDRQRSVFLVIVSKPLQSSRGERSPVSAADNNGAEEKKEETKEKRRLQHPHWRSLICLREIVCNFLPYSLRFANLLAFSPRAYKLSSMSSMLSLSIPAIHDYWPFPPTFSEPSRTFSRLS